jgi:hypothetical protein
LDWDVLLLLCQLLKSVVNRLRNQRALLDPAFRAAGGADSRKAPFALEDFDPITVFHDPGLAEDRGDVVAKDSLRSRNIRDLLHSASTTTAAGQ